MPAAKKTAAKKVSAKKPKPDAEPELKSNEEIAKEVLAGKWDTGRERTIKLINAGYDALEIQREVAKQRVQS